MRPHILWFGETYWPGTLDQASDAASHAQAAVVVDTSAQVWPPAQLALLAQRAGALLIDINPQPTDLSRAADVFLPGKAGELLPEVVEALDAERGGRQA